MVFRMKNVKTLSPKTDIVFQHLFGEVGSEKITGHFFELICKVTNLSKIQVEQLKQNLTN